MTIIQSSKDQISPPSRTLERFNDVSTPVINSWSIRSATLQDAEPIASLMANVWKINEAWSVPAAEVDKLMEEQFSPNAVRSSMESEDNRTLVAVAPSLDSQTKEDLQHGQDQIIGVAQSVLHCIEPRATSSDPMKLWRLYVDFDHHGTGAAQALFDETITLAKREKAGGIWLTTWTKSHRAIRFYERNGFKKIGTEGFKVGDVYQEDWVMERTI